MQTIFNYNLSAYLLSLIFAEVLGLVFSRLAKPKGLIAHLAVAIDGCTFRLLLCEVGKYWH